MLNLVIVVVFVNYFTIIESWSDATLLPPIIIEVLLLNSIMIIVLPIVHNCYLVGYGNGLENMYY